jgi:hypothetical protein
LKLKSVIWKMYLSVRILLSKRINTAPESIKVLCTLSSTWVRLLNLGLEKLKWECSNEQYKLDKILKDLDADVLYDAIINDKIDNIRAKMMLKKVFNLTLWCFLHPQSRYLFKSLYEWKRYKMPSLFLSVKRKLVLLLERIWIWTLTKHRWLYF